MLNDLLSLTNLQNSTEVRKNFTSSCTNDIVRNLREMCLSSTYTKNDSFWYNLATKYMQINIYFVVESFSRNRRRSFPLIDLLNEYQEFCVKQVKRSKL